MMTEFSRNGVRYGREEQASKLTSYQFYQTYLSLPPSLPPSLLPSESQIDTLLQDVSGDLPPSNPVAREQSPLSNSNPVAKEKSPPSNQSGKLFKWLLGLGLGGYTSALESSGFDDLAFLVRHSGHFMI